MEPNTHLHIRPELCGRPTALSPGTAAVSLVTTPEMGADAHGLVHGGFVFGLADYAAMLAVNDPNVVLGAAEVRFLAPVRMGEVVVAEAAVQETRGRWRQVTVEARVGETAVFSGSFSCFVLEQHVLAR